MGGADAEEELESRKCHERGSSLQACSSLTDPLILTYASGNRLLDKAADTGPVLTFNNDFYYKIVSPSGFKTNPVIVLFIDEYILIVFSDFALNNN